MSNPFSEPTKVYMYTLKPARVAIMTEGPTESEAAIVAKHWDYTLDLHNRGKLIFAGRTLITNEDSFASVVIHAESEEEARAIMEADPGVREEIFSACLYPYQVLLQGQ